MLHSAIEPSHDDDDDEDDVSLEAAAMVVLLMKNVKVRRSKIWRRKLVISICFL